MQKLNELDLSREIAGKAEYVDALKEYQLALIHYQQKLIGTRRSLILAFEGPDASGKGGAIKRLTESLDPRTIHVYSILKPSAEEYQHHYLWRFWNRLPAYGEIGIFDRTWYGRVLVERIERFATEVEWKRAFDEINDFEKLLTDDGAVILKFYLQISKDEQLRRFKKREIDPYKRWKINDEDWRNRKKWDAYLAAADEMFARTHHKHAPWHLIEAEHKWFARIKTLKIVTSALQAEFGPVPVT